MKGGGGAELVGTVGGGEGVREGRREMDDGPGRVGGAIIK